MDVTVLRLGPDDAGELLTLLRAAYVSEAVAHGDLTIPHLTRSLDDARADLADPAAVTLGLRTPAGRLVGTVRVTPAGEGEAELGRLAVAPDLQGHGLGTRLAGLAEAHAPAGTRRMRLFTGEKSVGNLRLYRRLGYVETHRTPWAGYELVHLVKPLP